MGWSVAVAAIAFSGLFIVLPALAGKSLGHAFHGSFPVVEGIARLGIFIVYLLAISRLRDIRRVFQYHGAEHKAIAAYENGVELTPETAQQFSTAHVRCGTNFLLTVMLVAIVVYSVIPRPNLLFVIGSRFVLVPLIAGLSYEVIRLSARNMNRVVVRALMRPGSVAAAVDHPHARPRPARGRDHVAASRDDGRADRRCRLPRRSAHPGRRACRLAVRRATSRTWSPTRRRSPATPRSRAR